MLVNVLCLFFPLKGVRPYSNSYKKIPEIQTQISSRNDKKKSITSTTKSRRRPIFHEIDGKKDFYIFVHQPGREKELHDNMDPLFVISAMIGENLLMVLLKFLIP